MQKENSKQIYYKIIYFFINNQIVFKRMIVVLLILLNIILWWISGVKLVNYFSSAKNYNKSLTELVENTINWSVYHEQQKPISLKIISVNKVKISNNKYDLVAKINNPNTNWDCKNFKYSFVVDGFVTDWQEAFILPEQDKYLFKFSYNSATALSQVDVKIQDFNWSRVKNIDQDRILILQDFIIENKEFNQENKIAQVKFDAINKSHFSFWQLGWQIILYQNNRVVGVNYVTTQNFISNQTRKISSVWNNILTDPKKIEIIPDIDIFNENNYILSTENPVNLIRGAKTKR